ncbi:ATP-binding cassette domain-containing protein [Pseudonocardia sp. ICBG1293]|uniref:ATP-binding cassette domain-containing protein n=1 Tax=Pseudonocardia sp. ICBG1293 TaxID=2844382 RepID=UPI0027DF7FE3|nr:ATP-binding cassette domain-containing protein [Pseudonocardia sp. ICBG1293]
MTTPAAVPAGPALDAQDLVLRYDERVVVDGLTVHVPPGRITVVVGPNACGKSTLLRGLGRIVAPTAGTVRLDGTDVRTLPGRELARRLGLLPQSPTAPDGITVADLVERGRSPHQGWFGGRADADDAAVADAMRATGVLELADRPVDELSGGQRQRVWIAMVLAQDTGALLLDEPTTFLDLPHAVEVLDLLVDRNRDRGSTVVVVLHDLNLACRYADHLIAMADGAIVAQGPPGTTMTADLVRRVFGMESRVVPDPVSGTPMVVPAGRHHPVAAAAGHRPPAAEVALRSEQELRAVVPDPHPLVAQKSTDRVDDVAARFVAASPLVFLGTTAPDGTVTVTPRGDVPGAVRVLDGGRRLAVPERPGNRRVDSMRNLLEHDGIGLTFCVPRSTHVLRVHGHGRISRDPEILGLWAGEPQATDPTAHRPPPLAIVVEVTDAYVHCGRALKASGLWDPQSWGDDDAPGVKELADAARADRAARG